MKKAPKATEKAKALAGILKLKLEKIPATGKGGLITVRDVRRAEKPRTGHNAGKKYALHRKDYTEPEVVAAILASRGYMSLAATNLGSSQQTIRNWVERSEACREALVDVRTARGDRWELALESLIRGGNPAATIFGLKTQYRDRGYVERTEISTPGKETIGIEIL